MLFISQESESLLSVIDTRVRIQSVCSSVGIFGGLIVLWFFREPETDVVEAVDVCLESFGKRFDDTVEFVAGRRKSVEENDRRRFLFFSFDGRRIFFMIDKHSISINSVIFSVIFEGSDFGRKF